ncbi:MAG: hypothetical protein RL885_28685 [Planctomycetota bacterium]
MKSLIKLLRNKKGAALVEYGLLIAGVALVTVAAVAVFGNKTNDMIAATAAVLPGAHADDNGPIQSGTLIETTSGESGDPISVDIDGPNGIFSNSGTERLGGNLGVTVEDLVTDTDNN